MAPLLNLPPSWAFPFLVPKNHVVTSPKTPRYNCIAWAAGDNQRWWWPDPDNVAYWPAGATREATVAAFIEAFGTLGYQPCINSDLEPGYQKVPLYAL
jgi:hypothetical protein